MPGLMPEKITMWYVGPSYGNKEKKSLQPAHRIETPVQTLPAESPPAEADEPRQ
jgi:hypothetical protein